MDGLIIGIILLLLISFVCEFVDSSLGMGYGTTLTPLLLLFNFPVLQVVPAVLFSEFFAAGVAALCHHLHGNVLFSYSSEDFRIVVVLVIFGIFGGIIGVIMAVSIPTLLVTIYICCLVIAMGVLILARFRWTFSWKKITTFGIVSAFNKGLSGGGYGPVVAGGQILSGRDSKRAIGSTAFAETIVCLTSWLLFITLMPLTLSPPSFLYFELPLMVGAVLSAPLATYAVKITLPERMTHLVGAAAIILGIFSLTKTLFGDFTAIALGGTSLLLIIVILGIIKSRERIKSEFVNNENHMALDID